LTAEAVRGPRDLVPVMRRAGGAFGLILEHGLACDGSHWKNGMLLFGSTLLSSSERCPLANES
jgi:hypothetical protein